MEFYKRGEADRSLPPVMSFWHKLALSTLSCLHQKLGIDKKKKKHGVRASAVAWHNQAAVSAKVPSDSRYISTTSEFDLNTNLNYTSRNISPYTAQSVALGDPGSIPGKGRRSFLIKNVQTSSWTHPAFYSICMEDSFPGVKRLGREANNSPLLSTEVRNALSYPSASAIRLHGVYVDNLLFY